jgi:MFS family permease
MLVGLLAPACSPAIGGLLVQSLSWRWVFFASLPIALLTFGLAALWIKDERRVARPGTPASLSLLRDPLLRFSMLVYLCVPGTLLASMSSGCFICKA